MKTEYSAEEANAAADWVSHMRTPFKGVLEVSARSYAERIKVDEAPAEHPLIIATLREGSIIRGITFTSKGGAEISFRFEGCDPNTSEKILSGTADFGKPPAQAAQVSDALPAAVKACDEEMQKYGHKFAGAVAGDAMRAALLTVWPNPPAHADEGSVPPIPTEIDWTHLKAFVTFGFYDEAQCQKFIQWAQGARPPAPVAQVPEGFEFNLECADAALRKLTAIHPITPPEAACIKAVIVGAGALLAAPTAEPVAQGEVVYQARSKTIQGGWSDWADITKEHFVSLNAAIANGACSQTRVLYPAQPRMVPDGFLAELRAANDLADRSSKLDRERLLGRVLHRYVSKILAAAPSPGESK